MKKVLMCGALAFVWLALAMATPAAAYFPPNCPAACDHPSTQGPNDGCLTAQCFRCAADFSCSASWQTYLVSTSTYQKCVRVVKNNSLTHTEVLISGPAGSMNWYACNSTKCANIAPDCWGYHPLFSTLFSGCSCDSVYGGSDPEHPGGPYTEAAPTEDPNGK